MDGKKEYSDGNNNGRYINSYSPSQPNNFKQNNNLENNEILKKRISKQAVENQQKKNIAKNNGITDSDKESLSKNLSMNESKNVINSIHSNKNNSSNTSELNKKDQKMADVGKKALSTFITGTTGIPKPMSDKMADKTVDKSFDLKNKIRKIQMICAVVAFSLVFVFVSSFVYGDDSGDSGGSVEKRQNLGNFYSSNMSDEELYNFFVDSGYVDHGTCTDSSGNFDSSCPFVTFMNKIKSGVDNEDQFLYIFYAISYNRLYYEYINKDDELDDLINNRNSLSSYLNGEYIDKYRKDIEKGFDLYGYISKLLTPDEQENSISNKYYSCSSIVVDGMEQAMSLNDYISGVTYSEFSSSSSADAWKAFSVMLRTYIVKSTRNCKEQFEPGDLVYSEGVTDDMKNAVNEKKDIILVTDDDTTGNVVYGEFCYNCNDNNKIYDEKTYEDIIKSFYPDYKLFSMTSSFGGPINGAYTDLFYYTSFPVHKPYDDSSNGLKNIKYYNQEYGSSTYQCPWWVKARALEMLNTIKVEDEEARKKVIGYINSSMGNGNQWYSLNSLKDLPHSQDSSQARPGAIVSWTWENPCNHKTFIIKDKDGNVIDCPNYGHVGIIEKVTYKADGTIDTIYVSESGGDLGIHVNKYTVDSIKKGWAGVNGDYTFLGYVYLLN